MYNIVGLRFHFIELVQHYSSCMYNYNSNSRSHVSMYLLAIPKIKTRDSEKREQNNYRKEKKAKVTQEES